MGATERRIVSGIGEPYDGLYAELEGSLKGMDGSLQRAEEYLRGIGLVRGSIEKLRALGAKHMRKEADEIGFFRNVWPVFYAKLFLYIWLYRIGMRRELVTADEWLAVISAEESRAESFFRRNLDFWWYYRSGATVIDEQFTRAYSHHRIFDPLAMIIDQDLATLASCRAARGLAFEEYLVLLKGDLRIPAELSTESHFPLPEFEFDGTDAEGQEWLMELFASKVIRKKGGEHLNLSELNRWFKYNFGHEFGKLFDKLNILRNRKIDPLRFLHKRMRAAEKWMDEKNGRR
jgi:RteC protein